MFLSQKCVLRSASKFFYRMKIFRLNDRHDAADIDIIHTFKLYDVLNLSSSVRFFKRKLF